MFRAMAAARKSRTKPTAADPPAAAPLFDGQPPAWPADHVERWPISRLLAYPQNPMTHSGEQVEQIAASMRAFGWTIPVLVDEAGVLIAGHGRVLAGQAAGFDEAPVMVARNWTDAQKRAYRIADNQLARTSDWSRAMLRLELTDLKALDFDLKLTGFPENLLVDFMAMPKAPDSFATFGADLATQYCCPRCAYRWSGSPDPGRKGAGEDQAGAGDADEDNDGFPEGT